MLGLLAGYYRGWLDQIVSRIVDIWMAFPPVLFSILLVAVLGTGLHSVIIAIVAIDWIRFCRVVRAETLSPEPHGLCRQRPRRRLLALSRSSLKEVLPNVLPTIVALLSLEMGIAVIVEAILSFVNLSISTDDPTWGGMIAEGRTIIHFAWWVLVFPLDRAVPDGARLRPVRRGAEGPLRPGAAMSARAISRSPISRIALRHQPGRAAAARASA